MTNLGPLTTTFTPIGPDCSSTFIGNNGINEWIQYGVGAAASLPCLPSGFVPSDPYYYSPGLCPSGYTSACFAQISLPTRSASETQATCCPSSYTCREDRGEDPFGCLSCFIGTLTFAVSTFTFFLDSAGMTTQISAGTTTTVRTDDCIRAYGPVVHIVAGDIQSITSPTSDPSITSFSTNYARTATATGPTTSWVGEDINTTRGLGAGAAAGIGVGSGLAAIFVAGFVVFFLRRRRRRLRAHENQGQEFHANSKPEQDFSNHHERRQQQQQQQQTQPSELDAERLYEL
ncbi:hypothetical protein F5Y10DRAFT_290307 [Nemania abortiva]|nr:hypothetical protein F5Y10DRAFT_290307 [Nemania abortiva]